MLFKGNSSSLQLIIEKLQSNKEHSNTKDTLGPGGASFWASEDPITSASSSCATPNPTTEASAPELSFTVGVTAGTPHLCRFCDKAFPKQNYLKKHEQTHADCMPFRCEFCLRLFKHKRSRDRHIKLHTGDRKYKCTMCNAAFSRSDHLKIHMKTHDHQKPFQCAACNRGYNTAAALTSHMQNHKRENENSANEVPPGITFKCLQCSKLFRKPEDLQNHMNTHHLSDSIPRLSVRSKNTHSSSGRLNCLYCTKNNFSSMDALQAHVGSVHTLILNGDLKLEMTEMKQPASPLRSTTSISNAIHKFSPQSFQSSSPSYFCEFCLMRFSSLQTLQKHLTSIHNNSKYPVNLLPTSINNDKLYCAYCAMHFFTPEAFTEHYFIFHSSLHPRLLPFNIPEQMKPTDLSISRKTSSLKRSLNEDLKHPKKKFKKDENANTNAKQYNFATSLVCNSCLEPFSDLESFETHSKFHIEDTKRGLLGGATLDDNEVQNNKYTCPHCRSVFSSSEEINQHLINHFLAIRTTYSCKTFHMPFEKVDGLQQHVIETHSRSLYSCSICKDVFETKMTLQVHLVSKHSTEAKIYRCPRCPIPNNIFHSEIEFVTHVKTMHASNPFLLNTFSGIQSQTSRCMVCFMNFSNEVDLQLHLATHHSKPFQCNLCSETFLIEYLLEKHIQTYHSSPQHFQRSTGNHDQDRPSGAKELSSKQSPGSCFRSPVKKMENGDSRKSFMYSDIFKKKEFTCEINLINHKKETHHRLSSIKKTSNDTLENSDDQLHQSPSYKRNSDSSSPSNYIKSRNEEIFSDNSNNNMTSCEICEQHNFANEAEVQSHKLIHEKRTPSSESDGGSNTTTLSTESKCNVCDKDCSSPTNETSSSIRCPQFHLKFENGSEVEMYLTNMNRKRLCQMNHAKRKEFRSQFSMKRLNSHECRLCRAVLPNGMQLQIHLIEHNFVGCTLFPCCICSSVFISVEALQTHTLEHELSARPYSCSRCDQKFVFPSELEHHNYLHLDENRQYYYIPDSDTLHEERSSPSSSLFLSSSVFNSKVVSKYNCAERKVDFARSNYERKSHFDGHNNGYKSKKDPISRLAFIARSEINDDKSENQNITVDSDDEQIDVVTTKTKELSVENYDKSE